MELPIGREAGRLSKVVGGALGREPTAHIRGVGGGGGRHHPLQCPKQINVADRSWAANYCQQFAGVDVAYIPCNGAARIYKSAAVEGTHRKTIWGGKGGN